MKKAIENINKGVDFIKTFMPLFAAITAALVAFNAEFEAKSKLPENE